MFASSGSAAGVDVKHPLRIAAVDAPIGRIADLQGSRSEQPEWAGDRAFSFTRYRIIPKRTTPPSKKILSTRDSIGSIAARYCGAAANDGRL